MGDKILVPISIGYGRAVEGLGDLTDNVREFMREPYRFKLVLFTGGEDVDPFLYDEEGSNLCHFNSRRDAAEIKIFERALSRNIKMAGICRGAQLLNVLAGGRLMRHINNHVGGWHYVTTSTGENITTNTLHHQMVIPGPKAHVTAWSRYKLSSCYIGKGDKKEKWEGKETEAIIIPAILSCGVQWHPEIMAKNADGYKYFHSMVADLLSMNMNSFTEKYVGDVKSASNVSSYNSNSA